MPLYMDMHNAIPKGATAADVAAAHAEDLKIQERYGVKYLNYWVDAAAGKVFCLVEAPVSDRCVKVGFPPYCRREAPETSAEIVPETTTSAELAPER